MMLHSALPSPSLSFDVALPLLSSSPTHCCQLYQPCSTTLLYFNNASFHCFDHMIFFFLNHFYKIYSQIFEKGKWQKRRRFVEAIVSIGNRSRSGFQTPNDHSFSRQKSNNTFRSPYWRWSGGAPLKRVKGRRTMQHY